MDSSSEERPKMMDVEERKHEDCGQVVTYCYVSDAHSRGEMWFEVTEGGVTRDVRKCPKCGKELTDTNTRAV